MPYLPWDRPMRRVECPCGRVVYNNVDTCPSCKCPRSLMKDTSKEYGAERDVKNITNSQDSVYSSEHEHKINKKNDL